MDGFLCIDKPAGHTSRDVVNRVQRIVRPIKVGHAGTLDPLATGILVVGVGRATRLIRYVQQLSKDYVGSFLLGQTSDTEDVSGDVVPTEDARIPSREQVDRACRSFQGEILQRPPAYSALKLQGRRAYDLARQGKRVELQARPVMIHALEVVCYAYPELKLRVRCGSGTYIRSLGRDLGEQLGCGAVMSSLRRTAIGSFTESAAQRVEELTAIDQLTRHLRPPITAVAHLPSVCLSTEQIRALAVGQRITLDRYAAAELAGIDDAGQLLAILARTDKGGFRPAINFCA